MRKKNYKGRCEKQTLEKFTTICKTYDPIQSAYANILVKNKDVSAVGTAAQSNGFAACNGQNIL